MKNIRLSFFCVCLLPTLYAPASAQSVEAFYKDRQINFIIGGGAGGGYDVYFRALARHMGKHIPGHPTFIPKNVPGAGGLVAASSVYTAADRDGSTIGAFANNVTMDPLFGNPGARYDALKFNWIGSIGKLQNVCATWHKSPIKTIKQATEREVIVGAAGATSNTALMPRVLNALLDTRFRVVAGYDPGTGLTLSIERGEVEGICGLSWSTMKASRPHWIKDHLLNVIVQMGLEKLPDLPKVPSALDLVKDSERKRVLTLVLMRQEPGRPVAVPPGVPADRVAALRKAFDATMKDPDFVKEANKLNMEIEPLTGAQIHKLLADAYATPKPIIQKAAELLRPQKKGSPKKK
ncbi:MAG: Bug family tripartite tricarboxylate transporter substrate binding protein [Xanthobacteraceae bacterium]